MRWFSALLRSNASPIPKFDWVCLSFASALPEAGNGVKIARFRCWRGGGHWFVNTLESTGDAGWSAKEGMERSDLPKSMQDFYDTRSCVNDHSADDAVLVVGNPCNTGDKCHVPAMCHTDRFYAMTMRWIACAQSAGDQSAWCHGCHKWLFGNHSSTQYRIFIMRKLMASWCHYDIHWLRMIYSTHIKHACSRLAARGASSALRWECRAYVVYADAWHHKAIVFSRTLFAGEYGIDEGLIFSVPCRTEGGKLKVITGIPQNEFGEKKIQMTLDELRKERDAVKELGLI